MKPSLALEQHLAAIHAMVTRHKCVNPRVFGSVLLDGVAEDSGLGFLVDPTERSTRSDLEALGHELSEFLKVRVRVVTAGDLPEKGRQQVLDEAQSLDRLLIGSASKRFYEALQGLAEADRQG